MPSTLSKNKPRYDGLKVTREEYLDLEDDGFKYDMKNGVLTMAPSPNFEHSRIAVKISRKIDEATDTNHAGEVVIETDVFLPDGGDCLRPDISFILNENMGIVKTHIHGTPDLVCEVLSDATRERDLNEKADRYLKNGVKEYWIVDPKKKSIELWQNRIERWEKTSSDSLTSSLLKNLIIKKEEIFL